MDQLIPIEQKIHEIRGQKVMLDFDLAEMYQVETKRLKEQVRRNIERFPSDFMFQLTEEEFKSLRSQFATSKRGGTRYMPFVFTEHGAFALSFVLNSEIAVEISIRIIRAFVAVRHSLMNNNSTSKEIAKLREIIIQIQEDMEILNQSQENADGQIDDLFQTFAKLSAQIQSKTAQLGRIKVEGFRTKPE